MDTQENVIGQSFEEKTAQVRELLPSIAEVDPLAVFCPIGVDFALMGRKFTIRPLPLRKLAILERLGKELTRVATDSEADLDKAMASTAEIICMIVDVPKEDNTEFFLNNLTKPQLEWIFQTTANLSHGINPKKG